MPVGSSWGGGGGGKESAPPPPPSLGTMVHASDSCIVTLYTAAMIINDITADLNTTKHLAVY